MWLDSLTPVLPKSFLRFIRHPAIEISRNSCGVELFFRVCSFAVWPLDTLLGTRMKLAFSCDIRLCGYCFLLWAYFLHGARISHPLYCTRLPWNDWRYTLTVLLLKFNIWLLSTRGVPVSLSAAKELSTRHLTLTQYRFLQIKCTSVVSPLASLARV